MELLEYSFLRLAGAAFVPFALFIITTAARRSEVFERYSWGTVALGLVALTWLLNGYLNQNTQLLAFMYPMFFGFCALLGPAFYYSLLGYKTKNVATAIMHLSPAVFIFTSGMIASIKFPLTQEDFDLLFSESGRISSISWSLLGDQLLAVLLLPVHFGAYAASALYKTRDKSQLFITLPIFLTTCLFAWVYSYPGTTEWNISLIVVAVEVLLIVLLVRYMITDSPKIQYERKQKLHVEPLSYDDIITFLADEESAQQLFAQPKINVDRVAHISNIEAMRWRNYLSDENMSFSDLKKKYRIAYAERLIEEGFLEKYTVDSLAETIGYSSRTSFYSAYKEVMGKPWQRNNS